MKKTLTALVLTVACAAFCAVGFAACDGDDKEAIGVVIASVENPDDKKNSFDIGGFVYGEDGKIKESLTGLKFYKEFDDHSYAEAAESELQVKYEKDNEVLSAKPETFTPSKNSGAAGTYRFTYSLKDAFNTASVTFEVERAKSTAFTAALSKNEWHYGDKPAAVTVKNPAGKTMTLSQGVYESGVFTDTDDSQYGGLSLCAMTKTYYTSHQNAVTYSALTTIENEEGKPNYGYNQAFGENLKSYPVDESPHNDLTQGEYVLFACISDTSNYKEIVCTAEFTVTAPDSPLGKTFVLTDLTARGDGGAEAPEETVGMAAELKTANLGKTVVCAANGKLTGECDFGFGSFDELTGDDILTLTFGSETDPLYVSVKDKNGMELTGTYLAGVLTLSIQQRTDGDTPVLYYFIMTFELQTAEN